MEGTYIKSRIVNRHVNEWGQGPALAVIEILQLITTPRGQPVEAGALTGVEDAVPWTAPVLYPRQLRMHQTVEVPGRRMPASRRPRLSQLVEQPVAPATVSRRCIAY